VRYQCAEGPFASRNPFKRESIFIIRYDFRPQFSRKFLNEFKKFLCGSAISEVNVSEVSFPFTTIGRPHFLKLIQSGHERHYAFIHPGVYFYWYFDMVPKNFFIGSHNESDN